MLFQNDNCNEKYVFIYIIYIYLFKETRGDRVLTPYNIDQALDARYDAGIFILCMTGSMFY